MLQPDDVNVGEWITVREAPNTNFDNLRGIPLLVKAVDIPFIVCRFYTPPLNRTNVILDSGLCQLMRVTDFYVQTQLGPDLILIAAQEQQRDLYVYAHHKALEQAKNQQPLLLEPKKDSETDN